VNPKTGLALSGGAAFGAYQAGVWKAIEEARRQPDIVSGISIGAINAWLISRGASSDELRELWLDLPGLLLPGREKRFSLPWTSQNRLFRAWVDEVFARYHQRKPRLEARLALLEAARCRIVTVRGVDVRRDHLLAACALPGVEAPVRVDGKLHLDCGVVRYIPLEEAIEAGADQVIVVDLLAAHPFPLVRRIRQGLERLRETVAGRRAASTRDRIADVRQLWVCHPRPLGGVLESFRWERSFAERLHTAGYHDGRAALAAEAPFRAGSQGAMRSSDDRSGDP